MAWEMFYNDTVTIFNNYIDDNGEEAYNPTVLNKVNLVIVKSVNTVSSGNEEADTAKLFIMPSILESDAEYIKPIEYSKLDNADKPKYFTFNPGADFFIEGDLSTISDMTYNKAVKNYDHTFRVTNVDKYADVMPHFEIGGK